jgi:hypothetical protein
MEQEMSEPIIPAKTAIQTFRDAGYKNTAAALAELIDNSIEANGKDIQVISFEKEVQLGKRTMTQIQEIAIYDDGGGMSPEVLAICLQFGNGTRMQSRKGMGRFGIGLPNASISQARRVEVYSWQEGGHCNYTYLDVDEIISDNLHNVNLVTQVDLPKQYANNIDGVKRKSGTVVVWKKCDRLDIARSKTLFRGLEKGLCRVYRHYLDDDDSYGKQVKITLKTTGANKITYILKANDPLYLMKPNNVPGYSDKPTNLAFGDVIRFPVEYDHDGNTSQVEIRFSMAMPETQALGGNSPLGQHYRNNVGISFVRAAREIDFGVFNFFNGAAERQRWWGCEIRFEPILDELFGVTNNKQAIRGIRKLDEKEFKLDHPDDWTELFDQDLKLKLILKISRYFEHNNKSMMDVITSRKAGKRLTSEQEMDKPTKIANKKLEGQTENTKSSTEGKDKSDSQKIDEWKERIEAGDKTLTTNEIGEIAEIKKGYKIEKDFEEWPGSVFFSVKVTGSTCVLILNRSHPFFTDLYEPMLELSDDKFIDAMDLALMAYARMEDELYSRSDELDEIREKWGRHLKNFLLELRVEA